MVTRPAIPLAAGTAGPQEPDRSGRASQVTTGTHLIGTHLIGIVRSEAVPVRMHGIDARCTACGGGAW